MINPASTKTKILSIVCVALFALTFGLAAYLPSVLKGEITQDDMSISRSLEYGYKIAIIIGLLIAFGILAYISYYRGHNLLYFRFLLMLIILALTITIIWITVDFNMKDHYILATVIFISVVVHITTISYVIYKGLKLKKTKNSSLTTKFLISLPILAILGIVGLGVGNISSVKNGAPELFPAFENYMLVIQSISILALGFI